MKTLIGPITGRMYVIRCIAGRNMLALTWAGAISELKLSGPDASVHTLAGDWVAGRRVMP